MRGEKHGTVRGHQEERSEQLLLHQRRIPLSVRSGYLSVSDTGVWGVVGVVLSVLLVREHE